MKFLVDENIGYSVVKYLRSQGYDTKSVTELYPSRDDTFLFNLGYQDDRIIVTSDKDFGYLVFRTELPPPAVILLRIRDESPALKINVIKAILDFPKEKILNHFIVASEDKIRIRPLVN